MFLDSCVTYVPGLYPVGRLTIRWSCQAVCRTAPARFARWRFIILRSQLNFGVRQITRVKAKS